MRQVLGVYIPAGAASETATLFSCLASAGFKAAVTPAAGAGIIVAGGAVEESASISALRASNSFEMAAKVVLRTSWERCTWGMVQSHIQCIIFKHKESKDIFILELGRYYVSKIYFRSIQTLTRIRIFSISFFIIKQAMVSL